MIRPLRRKREARNRKRLEIFSNYQALDWRFYLVSIVAWPLSLIPLLVQANVLNGLHQSASYLIALCVGHATFSLILQMAKITWLRLKILQRAPSIMLFTIFISILLGSISAQVVFNSLAGSGFFALELFLLRFLVLLVIFAGMAKLKLLRSQLQRLQAVERELRNVISIADQKRILERSDMQARMYQVMSELQEISGANSDESVKKLQFLSESVVRPWSHELATSKPLPPISLSAAPRPNWSQVWELVFSRSLIKPLSTAIWVSVFAIFYSVRVVEDSAPVLTSENQLQITFDGSSFLSFVSGTVGIFLATLLAAIAVCRLTEFNEKFRSRFSATTRSLWGLLSMAVINGLLIALLFSMVGLKVNSPIAFLVFPLPVLLIGFVVAVTRALNLAIESVIEQFHQANENLRWEAARSNQKLWSVRREMANLLHGAVRSAILAAALKINNGVVSSEAELTALQLKLEGFKNTLGEINIENDPLYLVFETVELWRGACEIAISAAPETLQQLRQDPVMSVMLGEVVAESVTNAIVHGKATSVSVEFVTGEDSVELIVTDNGRLAEVQGKGLGTEMIADSTISWSLNSDSGKTKLRAVFPYRPKVISD